MEELKKEEALILSDIEGFTRVLRIANGGSDTISIKEWVSNEHINYLSTSFKNIEKKKEELIRIRDKMINLNEQNRMVGIVNLPEGYSEEKLRECLKSGDDPWFEFPMDKIIPIDKNTAYLLFKSYKDKNSYFGTKSTILLRDTEYCSFLYLKTHGYENVHFVLLSEFGKDKL